MNLNYYKDIEKTKIICVDLETTGLCENDEILQISIVDGNNTVLFNRYIKPKNKKVWKEAERINGISPKQVKDLPTIDTYISELNKIFSEVEVIVGYNLYEFTKPFLVAAGIDIPKGVCLCDVMRKFAPVFGDWNEYFETFNWKKLSICTKYYGYDWGKEKAHNSLSDAKAILFCFFKMNDIA